MNSSLVPYLISFVITALVGLTAWRRRHVQGATAFALVAFGQAWWILGYLFELISPTLEAKLFWDDLQYVGVILWPLATYAFATSYTRRRLSRHRLLWAVNLGITAVFVALIVTSSRHGLIRTDPYLVPGEPIDQLLYSYGPALYLFSFYFYGLMILSVYLLSSHFRHGTRLYRRQSAVIIAGILIPVVGTLLSLFEIRITGLPRDFAPLTFAVGNLLIGWGLFHYRLFDLVPVARDAVMDNMRDAVIVMDARQRLVDANTAAVELMGRSLEELVGQTELEPAALWQKLKHFTENGEAGEVELEVTIRGVEHVFNSRLEPLLDQLGKLSGYVIVLHDVSRLKQIERALQERTAELEAANEELAVLSRVKDEFVSNVSHELRTPVQNIRLLQTLMVKRPDRMEGYLRSLERETQRLSDLIENLLTLSRIDLGQTPLELEMVDLSALLAEYLTDRQTLAHQMQLTFEAELDPHIPQVVADRSLIGQVFSIMLTNATHYTPPGGLIRIATCTRSAEGNQWVGFSISDTGPGVAEQDKPHLFERFYRGQAGIRSRVAGTGLGLAIAKDIVTQHGGVIEVNDNDRAQTGAIFSAWFPVAGSADLPLRRLANRQFSPALATTTPGASEADRYDGQHVQQPAELSSPVIGR